MVVEEQTKGESDRAGDLSILPVTEVLIKEAKRHQWRRYAIIAGFIIGASAVALTLHLLTDSTVTPTAAGHSKTTPRGSPLLPLCTASELRVSNEGAVHGAGNEAYLVLFQNVSALECTMRGSPSIDFVGVAGNQPKLPIADVSHYQSFGLKDPDATLPSSALAPHKGTASFWIAGTDVGHYPGSSGCVDASKMLVTLPNATSAMVVPLSTGNTVWFWCLGINVTPLLPGDSGTLPAVPLRYFFGVPSGEVPDASKSVPSGPTTVPPGLGSSPMTSVPS